jgi:hypothetical protein
VLLGGRPCFNPSIRREVYQLILLNDLTLFIRRFLKSEEALSGKPMVAVLRLAHKYCMEPIEEEILSHFKKKTDKEDLLNLLICSQIIGSTPLYDQAVAGLAAYRRTITLEEAEQIGLKAVHTIMTLSHTCMCGSPTMAYCTRCNKFLTS